MSNLPAIRLSRFVSLHLKCTMQTAALGEVDYKGHASSWSNDLRKCNSLDGE